MNGKALLRKRRLFPRAAAVLAGFLAPNSIPKSRRALIVGSAVLLGLILSIGAWACIYQARIPQRLLDLSPRYLGLGPASAGPLNQATVISPTAVVWEMLGQVDRDRALNDLRQLAGEQPICTSAGCTTIAHRATGSEGLGWAMEYLYENLTSLGYMVELRDWSRSGYADQNLIARKQGESFPDEEVYFIAHVDGVPQGPAADDNASSVVGGLELARVLSRYSFARTLVLFFSTGEEQGALGSKAYLDQLTPAELSAIQYAINRDMIGYDANGDSVMELFHGGLAPSMVLAQTMSETIDAYELDLDQRLVVGCP